MNNTQTPTARRFALALALSASSSVFALPFSGTDITIYDGDSKAGNTGWYSQREDQEVEPGMVKSQVWDLEGFWSQTGGKLAMVGGFDFVNGVAGYTGGPGELDFRSGDIFIDLHGDYLPGNAPNSNGYTAQQVVASTFGYEYALDIDWDNLTYDVVALNGQTSTQIAWYDQNFGSSPWKYVEGGQVLASGLSFSVAGDLTDAQTGYLGGTHYAAYDFDLGFLGGAEAYFHFTMGCGNDNLMGYVSVPEPSSIALLAFGVLGLGMLRVRKKS